jgi:hypothetical protein
VHILIFVIWALTLAVLAVWTLAAGQLAALLYFGGEWVARFKPIWSPLLDKLMRQLEERLAPLDAWLQSQWSGWHETQRWALRTVSAFLDWLGASEVMLICLVWGVGAAALLFVSSALTIALRLVFMLAPSSRARGREHREHHIPDDPDPVASRDEGRARRGG